MARGQPFDRHVARYESWFDRHRAAYESGLSAIRAVILRKGEGLEVGVGGDRFAVPLGVRWGVDPSAVMLRLARGRSVNVVPGTAEALPFSTGLFDFVLMVTAICFVDDVRQACGELFRVLKPGGAAVLGFVDRDSPLGQRYVAERDASPFYREATFYSTQELIEALHTVGFRQLATAQTLSAGLDAATAVEPSRSGHGQGGFVALHAMKPEEYDTMAPTIGEATKPI